MPYRLATAPYCGGIKTEGYGYTMHKVKAAAT